MSISRSHDCLLFCSLTIILLFSSSVLSLFISLSLFVRPIKNTHIHTNIHTHIYIYTHTHTHTHTYIHTPPLPPPHTHIHIHTHTLGGMKHLSESCLVVDSLGSTVRRELLEEFVQHQLLPYESLFGPDKPHFALDQVSFLIINYSIILKILLPSIFPSFLPSSFLPSILYSFLPSSFFFFLPFVYSSLFLFFLPSSFLPSFLYSSFFPVFLLPSFLYPFLPFYLLFFLPLMHACRLIGDGLGSDDYCEPWTLNSHQCVHLTGGCLYAFALSSLIAPR